LLENSLPKCEHVAFIQLTESFLESHAAQDSCGSSGSEVGLFSSRTGAAGRYHTLVSVMPLGFEAAHANRIGSTCM
jgi:hypothetical protein